MFAFGPDWVKRLGLAWLRGWRDGVEGGFGGWWLWECCAGIVEPFWASRFNSRGGSKLAGVETVFP